MAHYDVAVYYSSLPRIADRTRKMQVLEAFADGAQAIGAKTIRVSDHQIVDARLAVILGWVGTKLSGAHIMLRQSLIEHQRPRRCIVDHHHERFVHALSKWIMLYAQRPTALP